MTINPLTSVVPLSGRGRSLVLLAAFLGWMFAGTQMSITPLVARSAAFDLLDGASEKVLGAWFAWYNCAFLLGAAAGGLAFGWLGDRFGRAQAMGLSILCYSLLTGAGYFAQTVEQLLALRFLSCLGVGGMWPNGVALVAEAWPDVSRPLLAGLIGTAANVGIVLMGLVSIYIKITPESWRWVMLVGASPAALGLLALAIVPESPRWLAGRGGIEPATRQAPAAEVFRPPLLTVTLIGICLGTIPLLGGWGSGNWLIPWADKVGGASDPYLKGWTQVMRSLGGTLGSLAGGWVAGQLGRKRSYFLISLGSLLTSAYIFRFLNPAGEGEASLREFLGGITGNGDFVPPGQVNWFSFWAFMLGVVSGLYFGWLPLCLPELFPTRVRSTGAGVTFNFGRVAAAAGVLGAGALIQAYDGDYGRVGAVTSLIYAVGMIVIWFAPDTSHRSLQD